MNVSMFHIIMFALAMPFVAAMIISSTINKEKE